MPPQLGPTKTDFVALHEAALDRNPVKGLTHTFYRYPARFSPAFAATAIRLFSKKSDVVLDPYMGGGTTVIEALVAGRKAIGSDLNQLSQFITKVKTQTLTKAQVGDVRWWVGRAVAQMHFHFDRDLIAHLVDDEKTKNLHWPTARPYRKGLAGAMLAVEDIKTPQARAFARCALLRLGQWALDGRKRAPALRDARARLGVLVEEMLSGMAQFCAKMKGHADLLPPTVLNLDAAILPMHPVFSKEGVKADLVVTSPPYPGVHMLYHRWQINGRREAPAPYWLTECSDGHGSAYYNFADRRQFGIDKYFETSATNLKALRKIVRPGAVVVQMIAFSEPDEYLPRYLKNMEEAGFSEAVVRGEAERLWREVPGRRWHAFMKGRLNASREVVLVHVAS